MHSDPLALIQQHSAVTQTFQTPGGKNNAVSHVRLYGFVAVTSRVGTTQIFNQNESQLFTRNLEVCSTNLTHATR